MTTEEYLCGLKGRRVLIMGLGVSNRPLARMLLSSRASVAGWDGAPVLDAACAELTDAGLPVYLGDEGLDTLLGPEGLWGGLGPEIVFRTPGMLPGHPALLRATEGGGILTSEMELFFDLCPCPMIGVTGSDGKTTTTTLIARLLEAAGRKVWLGGNIGRPLVDLADRMSPEDIAVLELSSFQLMNMTRSPGTAVVTNLAPNHLDKHRDMAEYTDAKRNIYLRQGPSGRLVLNLDNEITAGFADSACGQVIGFSRRRRPEEGVWLRGTELVRALPDGRDEVILDRSELLLPGDHNVENFMAAICAVGALVPDEVIREVARSFAGVEHRIERVRILDGVTWYNDSIASSPSRTIAGLRSFSQKVILIAGGYDKHIPYDVLGPELAAHVKTLVLTGATGPLIREALERTVPEAQRPTVVERTDFSEAVLSAREAAQPGDIVILSPASASFDHFKNFAERGRFFKELVLGFEEEEA